MTPRLLSFFMVGVVGFIVQTAVLTVLTSLGHWPIALATALAIETAVLTNFVWHERWTWADRSSVTASRRQRLAKFHAANGATSLVGGVTITWLAVHYLALPPVIANALSVVIVAAANYQAADRWVFRAAAVAACLTLAPMNATARELKPETVKAWAAHVAATEKSLDAAPAVARESEPTGSAVDVVDGTISEWRGAVIVRDRTVAQVIDALVMSPTLPAAEEVIEARILSRHGDSLHTYMRLMRKAIVTVTYDTEHDVVYSRHSPALATSRSVATKIAEVGGGDRGFLWRLNSYWRYEQVGSDVRIELRSVSLSRRVPWLLRPVAMPIVERIGRESMRSTLGALAKFLEAAPIVRVGTSVRPIG